MYNTQTEDFKIARPVFQRMLIIAEAVVTQPFIDTRDMDSKTSVLTQTALELISPKRANARWREIADR